MIKASEIVPTLTFYDNRVGKEIHFKTIHGLCNAESKPNDFEPIPLTPEWLERFGFEVYGSEPYWKYADGINGMFKNNRFRLFTFQTHGDYVPVDYVHQLQNLYFALTGQELELKEKS